jgi:predicted deacylase
MRGKCPTVSVVSFSSPLLRNLEWPVFEAEGADDGPRLCLLGGVHGCEYSSIAAVRRFMRGLDTEALRGSIVAVPIVSPTSYAARSPFVVPEDGRNLNRSFPGDPYGSFTEVLAHHVFTEFIAPSDVLIDLHGGDMVEALEPFALYDDAPHREQAEQLARAFGFRYVVRDSSHALGGTTSGAAAAVGIPSVIAEAGGRGLLESIEVDRHVRGLTNALRSVGMLSGEPEPPRADQQFAERFTWLRCQNAGWWQADVEAGSSVEAGQRVGAVLDPFGDELEVITAPEPGAVLFLTTSPAVADDGLLLGLAAGLRPFT